MSDTTAERAAQYAAEIIRLNKVNAELLAALETALQFIPHDAPGTKDVLHPALSQARKAIRNAGTFALA